MTLVPIKDEELRRYGIPVKATTFYYYHHVNRYPQIFVKIGRRLFLVLEEWHKLVAENIGK